MGRVITLYIQGESREEMGCGGEKSKSSGGALLLSVHKIVDRWRTLMAVWGETVRGMSEYIVAGGGPGREEPRGDYTILETVNSQ